jgi:ribosomal protein L16 Arg81 hydroxylase
MLREARGVDVVVPAGCMLYLPCAWWHRVRGSPDFNVSFNYWYVEGLPAVQPVDA